MSDEFTKSKCSGHPVEMLLTIKAAAEKLGLPVFKIRRAAQLDLFPTYTLLNGRKLVRLSEVILAVERSHDGGSK